jgi:hypothetical protein
MRKTINGAFMMGVDYAQQREINSKASKKDANTKGTRIHPTRVIIPSKEGVQHIPDKEDKQGE